jgi:hypothetical protein
MFPRKIKEIRRKFIIGIDETNNGMSLESSNPHYQNATIVTGYMMEDPNRANYGSARHEGKGWAFGNQGNLERNLERGNEYLDGHPDFFYTLITEQATTNNLLSILKAEAITRITLQFLLKYPFLNTQNTYLIADEMDGPKISKDIHKNLRSNLYQSGLRGLPHTFKRNADRNVIAVRRADTVGYCLAGMHLFNKTKNWPRKSRMIPTESLIRLMDEFYYRDEGKYDSES